MDKRLALLPAVSSALLVAVIFYFFARIMQPFLSVIVASVVFAIFLFPIYSRISKKTGWTRLSALVCIVGFFLLVLTPVVYILINTVNQAAILLGAVQANPDIIKEVQIELVRQFQTWGINIDGSSLNIENEVISFLRSFLHGFGNIVLGLGSLILNIFFMLITTYFLLVNQKQIAKFIRDLQILPQKHAGTLEKRIVGLINGLVRGNLIVIGLQVLVSTAGFSVFGFSAPILLGFIYGMFSVLPSIGSFVVWVPLSLIVFANQGLTVTLLFAIWFIISNSVIDSFIGPRIIGKQANLHQVLIMFSVIGGITRFGILGIVLGPVIVALAFVVIEMYKEYLYPDRAMAGKLPQSNKDN